MSSTKRLKIFQVVECGGPGGTGHQVAAICRGLPQARFEVVLTFSVRSGTPEEYETAAGSPKSFHVPEMVREISPLKDFAALCRLTRIFKAEKPDVVHAHSSKAGFLARVAAALAGVPRIFYSPRGYSFLQTDRPAAVRLLYRMLEFLVSGIGSVVAVSPSEAALARPLTRGRAVHVVSDAFLGPVTDSDDQKHAGSVTVGACGRLTYARHPEAFVSLCQRLTDSRNGLKGLWIGGGEEESSVGENLENLNLLGKVEVTGWLKPEEALARMRGLDIFVHYSRWEGIPNAVLEAMALGLPVVASDVPGNRDAVADGETGFLVRNEVELLEQCLKLVDDPALRRRMGSAGRRRVLSEFTLERCLSSLAELYAGQTA